MPSHIAENVERRTKTLIYHAIRYCGVCPDISDLSYYGVVRDAEQKSCTCQPLKALHVVARREDASLGLRV